MPKIIRNALTPLKVRSLSTPGRYADGNGLHLVVDEAGAKRWILRTLVHGKRRDMGLGSVQLVPLAEARKRAAANLALIARDGGDPIAPRRQAKRLNLIKAAKIDRYEDAGVTVLQPAGRTRRSAQREGVFYAI